MISKNIIAIQGLKGSGKDEAAKYIRYILGTPDWMHHYTLAKFLGFTPMSCKWRIVKYATNIKKMLAILLNVKESDFEDRKFKETKYYSFKGMGWCSEKNHSKLEKKFNKALENNDLSIALKQPLSVRQILQFFGTDIMRKFFGDDLWVRSTIDCDSEYLIISDQRFHVEYAAVKNTIGYNSVIHLTRGTDTASQHRSEAEVQELFEQQKYSVHIKNDGTRKDLFNNLLNYFKQ